MQARTDRHRLVEATCVICGKVFYARAYLISKGFGRFCSRHCKGKFYGSKTKLITTQKKKYVESKAVCLICGKEFSYVPYRGQRYYCSRECYMKAKTRSKRGRIEEKTSLEDTLNLWKQFKASGLTLGEFASSIKRSAGTLSRLFKAKTPSLWETHLEESATVVHDYVRGRNFEYRVRDYYRKLGYFVLRSPVSRGLIDLVAVRKGEVLGIQCKLSKFGFSKKEKEVLILFCKQFGMMPIFAYRDINRRIVTENLNLNET